MTAGWLAYASALAAIWAPGQPDDRKIPPARPAVPFEKHAEFDCDWVMPAEPLIRGSIRRGEQSPVLQIFDPVFNSWSDNDYPTVEISAGGPGGRVEALGYVIHWAKEGSALGIFLDEEARGVVGGASQLQIWKEGRPVLNLALADTPSAAELAACVSEGD